MKKKLLLFLSIFTFATSSFAQLSFAPVAVYSGTESNSQSLTSADFNGDGNKDIITANFTANNISLFIGSSTGTFAVAANYVTGAGPKSIISADFNGDGKIDVVTANSGDNTVSLLLGTGTGSFSAAINYTVGNNPYSVFSGDFNVDGKMDLVTANYSSNNISVLLGVGTGSFAAAVNYAVGSAPKSVCSADFNGDGKLDIVTANSNSNNISLLLGSNTGTFSAATSFSISNSPVSLTSSDFNNDGISDLAVLNTGFSNEVKLYYGANSGTFSSSINANLNIFPTSIISADFNGDGKFDIAGTYPSSGPGTVVFLGNGNGTFVNGYPITFGCDLLGLIADDFNNDSKIDLAVTDILCNSVNILQNTSADLSASALNFDGVNDRVTINNPLTNSFTLETYIKTSTPSATGANAWQGSGILDGDVPGVANDFILSVLNNRIAFWDGSSSINVVSTSTVTDGSWKHVALTRAAGGQIKLYINGVLEATGTAGSAALNANPLIYFGNNFNAGTFTNISMDETRIWNRVLCQAEIQNNMTGELPPGQFGLRSYYKYNQGIAAGTNTTVTSLTDLSGNANHGTLSNFALTGTTSNWISPGAVTSGSNVANYASTIISISGANSICSGSSTTFTASGAVSSYTWTSGPTTSTISVSPTVTTTYSVVGTNSVGCISNMATKTLTVNPLPTASVTGMAVICSGKSTTLTATGGASYAWSTGATTASIVVTPAFSTAYTVTVTTAEGCSVTVVKTVTVNAAPTAAISGINTICEGKSTTLTASGGGTYAWNTGATTAAITVSPVMTTPYTVTVTSANGCTNTAVRNVNVNPIPTGTITGNTSICAGQSTTLTASGGATYVWSIGATTPSIVVAPAMNTTYAATVTSVAGCTVFTSKTVVVNSLPTPAISGLNNICVGQTTTLTASGGSTYLWSTGATTSTVAVNPTITTAYTATVTSAAGCTATATRNVNVNNLPTPNISGTSVICEGQSTTLTASGGTSYIWNTGANTAAITVSPTFDAAYTVTVTNTSGCKATAVRVVTVNAIPTASITGTAEICNSQSTTLTATGGTSYVWSTGANTSTINVSPSTNTAYTATVTSSAGCTATAVRIVTVNPLPTPAIAGLNTICVGQTTTLTATGGGTYLWNTGATSSTVAVSPTITTAYIATVTSAAGCSATANRNVTVNNLPTPNITGTSSICEGQSTTLTASGGTSYIWNTGANTAAITVSPTFDAAYTVTVTNASGCTATAVRVVTVNTMPIATITGNASICAGQSTTLTASGGTTYIWNTGAVTSAINVSPSTNAVYTATVTSAAGCTATAVRIVTVNLLPTPAISGLNTICVGQTTTLTVTGGDTYLWSTGAITSTIAVSPTITTVFTATATSVAGCTATANRNVTVNNLPMPNITGTFAICEGQSTTLTATGGTSYIWNTGATSASISVNPSNNAIYTATVTNAVGCSNTAVKTVTVNSLPVISVNSGTICSGESFTLSPSGATTYTISGGSTVVSPTSDATYIVTGTDVNGCVSSTGATASVVVNSLPVLTATSNNTLLCVGQTATLTVTGASSYTWSTNENTIDIAVSPTVTTTFSVNGTDANGCVNSTTISQDVSLCTDLASLSFSNSFVNVYPNPSKGVFNVQLYSSNNKIIVLDVLGKVILNEQYQEGVHSIDLHNYASGLYFIQVNNSDGVFTIRAIKE